MGSWVRRSWSWAATSNAVAVDNARLASTELSRRRVEREDVDLFLQERSGAVRRTEAG